MNEFKVSTENIRSNSTLNNLRQSEEILDLYNSRESDKRKSARIKEFVDEFTFDLHSYIMALERRKENPGSPIEDEEG